MDAEQERIDKYFISFCPLLCANPSNIECIGQSTPIPNFSPHSIFDIVALTMKTYSEPKPVLNLTSPCVVIGDIHGNLHDLLRIFTNLHSDFERQYLFLGDYVDRGTYSLDVVLLLFVLRCKFPGNFHLIRGNHEYRRVNRDYGFYAEVMERYDKEEIWESINGVFDCLPFVAIIDETIFCVHGGIGPSVTMRSISEIRVPSYDFSLFADITSDLVWSDPGDKCHHFLQSSRGLGFLFGSTALCSFLKQSGFKKMIRAHQCVNGVENQWNNLLYTVFSSSNYTWSGNLAGFLIVEPQNVISKVILDVEIYVQRKDAKYRNVAVIESDADQKRDKPLTFQFAGIPKKYIKTGNRSAIARSCGAFNIFGQALSKPMSLKTSHGAGSKPSFVSSKSSLITLYDSTDMLPL